MNQAAAGLAGLGLVGGVGAVTYDGNGSAKVTITDKQGRTKSVEITGDGGQTFSCPDGTQAKLEPIDIEAGRIKITLRRVKERADAIEKRYPNRQAPGDVVRRYNGLVKRHDRLVDAYNAAIDRHNTVIASDCEPSS